MNNNLEIKVKRIDKGIVEAKIPFYASQGAAGADLYACLERDIVLKPGQRIKVPTGLAIELPNSSVVAMVFARSGLADQKGLTLGNGVGVIDSDYRGEIMVLMVNLGQEEIVIQNGDRIAQIILMPTQQALFKEVTNLEQTERGEGGFGSTGTK